MTAVGVDTNEVSERGGQRAETARRGEHYCGTGPDQPQSLPVGQGTSIAESQARSAPVPPHRRHRRSRPSPCVGGFKPLPLWRNPEPPGFPLKRFGAWNPTLRDLNPGVLGRDIRCPMGFLIKWRTSSMALTVSFYNRFCSSSLCRSPCLSLARSHSPSSLNK